MRAILTDEKPSIGRPDEPNPGHSNDVGSPTANGGGLHLVGETPSASGRWNGEATVMVIEQPVTPIGEEMPTDEATSAHEEKPIGEATENEIEPPVTQTDAMANDRGSQSENESAIDPSQGSASATSDEPGHDGLEIVSETDHVAHGGAAILSASDGLLHASPSCTHQFKRTSNMSEREREKNSEGSHCQ